MKKIYKITAQDSRKIKKVLKGYEKTSAFRKLQAIMLIGRGIHVSVVAKITLYHERYIYELTRQYCLMGLEEFAREKRGGARRKNLTNEEETALLDKFGKKAKL